jgi:hypothetical protein
MPINFTAAGAAGTHALRKTNVNLEENFIYYNTTAGATVPSVFTVGDNQPFIFRNGTGALTITGVSSGSLLYTNVRESQKVFFAATAQTVGSEVYADVTALTNGNVSFNTPFVFSNKLVFSGSYSDRQAVKYYTNDTPLTGLVSGNTYYLKQAASPFSGAAAPLYTFSSHNFTSAGVTGSTGPTLSQLTTAYASAAWTANTAFFNQGNFQGVTSPSSSGVCKQSLTRA